MRAWVAECVGTALLVMAVVGSGIMGDRLSGGNVAIALLANSIATGASLMAVIVMCAPVSGAHFNPLVSLANAFQGGLSWLTAAGYVAAQLIGGFLGVAAGNLMFGEPAFAVSHHVRAGWPQGLSEGVATFGLLSVIVSCSRRQPTRVPFAVGAYITGAYWFTSSTSFANPAVTLARSMTNTFTGIRPLDVPGFLIAQAVGALVATLLWGWLTPPLSDPETP